MLQKRLASRYAITQPTADNTDIVTAGAILVLQKSGLTLGPTTSADLYQNVYQGAKIQPSVLAKTKAVSRFGKLPGFMIPGVGAVVASSNPNAGVVPRTYVRGERMWVTKIEVKTENNQEEVVLNLFTDAVNDIRYRGTLKIPFPKGTTDDQLYQLLGEVFRVQRVSDTEVNAQRPSTQPPVELGLGQTIDEVTGMLGQPRSVVDLGSKKIYVYKDMKITFQDGKVADVQ
jgi:hypothetical protein